MSEELKPSAGVMLPERFPDIPNVIDHFVDGWNWCIDEVARLNPCREQVVPVDMPERWEDRLTRMHPTIQAGCWPKRWVDDAKDYELGQLRALLAQSE